MTDTKQKFNDIIYTVKKEYKKDGIPFNTFGKTTSKDLSDAISSGIGCGGSGGSGGGTVYNHSAFNGGYTGDNNSIYVGDQINTPQIGDYPFEYTPDNGNIRINPGNGNWSNGQDWTISTKDTSINPTSIEALLKQMAPDENQEWVLKNKLDKDLVKGKLPFNLKKDIKNNLYYEFACAGYEKVLLQKVKDGINILLDDNPDEDDLIGDEFEFVCKGIKTGKQDSFIFIDQDLYDLDSYTAKIKSGILTIFVPLKEINKKQFLSINEEKDTTELELI
jgi:hypothetical protein